MTDNIIAAAILDDPYIVVALVFAALVSIGVVSQAVKEYRAAKASRDAKEVADLGREFAQRRRDMASDRFTQHRRVRW